MPNLLLICVDMGYNSDCRAKKNEVKCDGNNKNLNPDFLSRYVEAGRVSINRNVIAKCLEFYEISLLNYFVKDSHTFEPIQLNTNYVPRPADQSSPSASQVDTLSWCSHQIEMEGLGPRTRQNDNYARSPLYDHVNKLANLYRKQPRELPPIDFNQITPPQELDELLCTISICCKYYIAGQNFFM